MDKEIIITKYDDKGFIEVKCADGHYISNWDKEDIMNYTAAKLMYCPLDFDINAHNYYCVTEEQHNAYLALRDAKIKEKEEERRKANENRIGK